jgi:multiple sugar transport system ATP-binding protein
MSLKIEGLNKSYGSTHILKDINIDSKEGEFLILVGSSGCGKSTLLSSISGLETIDSGKIYNKNQDITHLSPKDRDISMVFQSYALYPNMTVGENILFGLKMRKTSKEQMNERLQNVSKILQIENLLHRKPAQLSGGQQQRVAMGRAIARDPSLYLFDEPLSNLDAKLRVDMRLEIKKLHQRVKKNIVYVTHDQIEAMTLADRIAIMKEGNIVQIGTPDEVYFSPKNIFIAKFIGSNPINLITGKAHLVNGKLVFSIHSEKQVIHIPIPAYLKSYQNKDIILGIRAENISNSNIGSKNIKISSKIALTEHTGSDIYVFTTWNNTEIKARCNPQQLKKGSVDLYLDPSQMLFFDAHEKENPRIS